MRQATKARLGSAYIRAVQVGGLGILTLCVADVAVHPPGWWWLFLLALTALTGAYAVRIPGVVVRLSVSEPIVFLATVLFGPTPGTLTAAVDALVMTLRLPAHLRTPHRILFNVGALAVTVLPSALLYFHLTGLDSRRPTYGPLEGFVGPLYVFAVCVFVFNSALVALAVSVERKVSAFAVWRSQFLWLSASYLASAAIAAILVIFTNTIDLALAGVLLPLVVVTFLTVKTTLGRLDDTNKHLGKVNTLYLSTIETLAMAIDAKDQVTHGHIRRVQRYAVGLARALGISDDRQLRAIEAAALLHDMGKLAIPEFILNKPGKLTTSEFAVMKTHAALGADILSSIEFPYPVVPIVRYHHENWDGSGYPEGIRGADIPIGARILSVVDCYDALTSDRPYRPAMTADQAIEILSQRRGKMYDPLVVDAFVRAHSTLCAGAEVEHAPSVLLANQLDAALASQAGPGDVPLAQEAPLESLRLLACLSPFPSAPPLRSVCSQLISSLRSIATFDTAALFVVNESSGDAEALFVEGSGHSTLARTRIAIGEQLTGWVAAHRTPVWNSNAALDFAAGASRTQLTLGSSMPLAVGDNLVGALTLYGQNGQDISVEQRRALESLLPTISATLADALQRPWIAIDCRRQHIRDAALSAMDSLLSHSRLSSAHVFGSALALSLDAEVADSPRAQLSLESAARTTATLLSPRNGDNRCVLWFGAGHLLFCGLDGASADVLMAEVQTARQARSLQALSFSILPLNTSLELQDRVRRMVETLPVAKPISGVRGRSN